MNTQMTERDDQTDSLERKVVEMEVWEEKREVKKINLELDLRKKI